MKSINIFGDIIASEADRWYPSEVTPAQIVDALKEANGDAVEVLINSNGGSVSGGLAIANALKSYQGEVTCVVLGVAASMASVIACAGKKLQMGEGAFLMMHNPWTATVGNADDLRKDADTLDKMRDSIISFYIDKCPEKSADDIKALLDAETWISRDDAKELGFTVEDYAGELKAAASLTRREFATAPESVKALFELRTAKPEEEKPAEAEAKTADATPPGNWEARFKGLSKKYNELKAEMEAHKSDALSELCAQAENFNAKIDELSAERDNFKSQLEQSAKDLEAAKSRLSELSGKLEANSKALLQANEDLAQTRDSLKAAEDKAAQLESTRDMLTAGVLTPPAVEDTYAAKYKAAKTPTQREALRKQKLAGKIN